MTNALPTDVGSLRNQAGEDTAKTMNEKKPVVLEETDDDSDDDGPYDFEVEDEDDGTDDDDAVEEFDQK
jgi:hypothetical protein